MKYLYIDTNPDGVTGMTHSPNYEMNTLLEVLWGLPEDFIASFKQDIITELKDGKSNIRFNFENFQIVILNSDDFLIYDSREADKNIEKTYFYIKQEALWQAIRDYNSLDTSKKYKRITISYDDDKVYFDLEPFDKAKE